MGCVSHSLSSAFAVQLGERAIASVRPVLAQACVWDGQVEGGILRAGRVPVSLPATYLLNGEVHSGAEVAKRGAALNGISLHSLQFEVSVVVVVVFGKISGYKLVNPCEQLQYI